MSDGSLLRTPLFEAHKLLGAKLVPFAGYDMPVQYPTGVLAEHLWTRENAGLFDVSHMGQCFIMSDSFAKSAAALEKLVPADIASLEPKQQRYTQFLNDSSGILDDLMVTRADYPNMPAALYLVVNAGRKTADFEHIKKNLPADFKFRIGSDLSLVALQGPKAESVLAKLLPSVAALKFMHYDMFKIGEMQLHISRSGYTGEDGFEISVHNKDVEKLWSLILSDPAVKSIGLGARDSLRLEAGLCLYGHDIDETTSPIEAGLQWSIAKRRRDEGGFIGSDRVQHELREGVARKRVGIKPDGRAPAREGTEIQSVEGRKIGVITSGGFGPTINAPVAMGYVEAASSAPATKINLLVRGHAMPATIVKLPFVPARFKR